tara:strand:- start:210 stop:740 length:531 start_codon:yes stop_codon:yes gene_type:complete
MRKITLILGGARSGKSVFGERLALNKDSKPIYIFTAQSFDEEMDERIRVHKDRRKKQSWQDVEATINLPAAISELSKKEKVILVDCLSLWLTNLIINERNIDRDITEFLNALEKSPGDVILISSEVGLGIVPDNEMSRVFRDYLGSLHQRVAAISETVIMMVAGIPIIVKGQNELS